MERISQTDVVIGQLKEFFLSDAIQVGDKLPNEKDLCTTLRVGRSTLREAIRAMEVMGYVKILPGRGAFLAHKKLDKATSSIIQWMSEYKPQVQDIVEIRESLENLSVKLAIEHGSPEDFERIDQCRKDFEQALEMQNYPALARLDTAFHQAIFEVAKNDLLTIMAKIIAIAFSEFREHSFRIKDHAANAVIPHREITQAILKKDIEMAQLQMSRHLKRILSDIDASLEETLDSNDQKNGV